MSKKALGSSNVRLPNEKKLSSLAVLFFISLILSLQLSAKEWKEEKPKMMKALAENDYGFDVTKYNAFRLLQDGRNYKKPGLKYNETFTLAEMTSFAGEDIVLKLPALISGQTKIKKEERNRNMSQHSYYLWWNDFSYFYIVYIKNKVICL